MKHLSRSLFLYGLFILLPIVTFANSVDVYINGMVCAFCAQGIEKKFKEIEGVEEVKVDLDKKVVTLKLKSGTKLSQEQIKSIVTDAGYEMRKVDGLN